MIESVTPSHSPLTTDGGSETETNSARPHVVLVVPRGEAVRNFLYSETLSRLAERARITLLSVVTGDSILGPVRARIDELVPLVEPPRDRLTWTVRTLTENAHDRWLWSEVAKNNWELRDRRSAERGQSLRRLGIKIAARLLGNRPTLRALTRLEQRLTLTRRSTDDFDRLFDRLQPDLVFNGSHIHGLAAELPMKVAHERGIPIAGFVFSWDNLTSRSRIFIPYDHYFVWHEGMKRQLRSIYPAISEAQVHITGTPQFDFHHLERLPWSDSAGDDTMMWSRERLCQAIGVDPARPYILWTTGIDNHFFDEHLHLRSAIAQLEAMDLDPAPQLVVRTYVKGTSPELKAMAGERIPGVVFPDVAWDPEWQTPLPEDLPLYTNLLRHAALGVNAASTVTLELLQFDKPVINLDFDPPGSTLPWCLGYERHIRFDHFLPVAESGATMVARSVDDMGRMLYRGLTEPDADHQARQSLLASMFGPTLDGRSGQRIAETLLTLADAGQETAAS